MFSSNQTNVEPPVPNYIEDVFSTWLYTGNDSTQNIVNGIDLSTKGGLVWIKDRTSAANHGLVDTVRGVRSYLSSDSTAAAYTNVFGYDVTAFNTNGFSLGPSQAVATNTSPDAFASWTFRKQPKWFDIQTWTGTGSNTTISHNLGSVPGCIMVKRTDTSGAWQVYHRSLANTEYLVLNTTAAKATGATRWNSTTPTSTVFSLGTDATVNASGGTYVAYIYAHDAGGFGLTGTDNVISCGSFTTDGSGNATVNLGYEPQWIMTKGASGTTPTDNWFVKDNMRGMPASASSGGVVLRANVADAETTNDLYFPTATGFTAARVASTTYIYIAIRRGPMKVPTVGTSVFLPSSFTGSNTVDKVISTNFTVDMTWGRTSNIGGNNWEDFDRLRGAVPRLNQNATTAEVSAQASNFDVSNGITLLAGYDLNYSTNTFINYTFARSPSVFDIVCYTGTATAQSISHNLGVVPELAINKNRDGTFGWYTQFNFTATTYDQNTLSTTNAANLGVTYGTGGDNFSAKPTASLLPLGATSATNLSAKTYVYYLFATCAGVSKVGSYTGNGTTQTINCGFTGGARFVLIKRTDSTGDWYVYDTARGMTVLTDPYLLLNSTAAETATLGSVTTATTGFALNASILSAVNTNAATYIFLAIA